MPNKLASIPLVPAVKHFMRTGGQTVDSFNARQAVLYLGLQLEELAEKVKVLQAGCIDQYGKDELQPLLDHLESFAGVFKSGLHQGAMLRCDHAEMIDADFDIAWVSIGALFSMSTHASDAISHGTHTNLDKFRDGQVLRDDNGKVQKPQGWRKPDFKPYVDTSIRD